MSTRRPSGHLSRQALFAACLVLPSAIAAPARSYAQGTPVWPADLPALTTPPAQILAQAATIPAEKFAAVTVLLEEEKKALDASGKVISTHHLIYRIETQAAIDSWSEASVEWESFYQAEPTILARVIRPDGSVAELDQKTITDGPANEQDQGTYSDDRLHKAPLPAVSVGAIIEEVTTLTDKEPYFSGGGVYRYWLQRDVPVVHSRLIVELPANLPFQYRLRELPGMSVTKEETSGVRRVTFDQAYLPPSIGSDIKLATPQPRAPMVEFSTGKSWAAVADTYRQLAEPQILPDQAKHLIEGATKSLGKLSPATDRLAYIQALVSHLHAEIRYTGVEFGESKLKPQTPAEVLKRHYGDCKDKAATLVAMLRASGIPASLALLDTGPGQDVTPDLPGMNHFDHAIAYVPPGYRRKFRRQSLWIDATAEFTHVGDLPYADQGRLALIIADGTQDLTLTPAARPEDSTLVETREFLLAEYGPAHVIETSATTGHFDDEYRSEYGEAPTKAQTTSLETYARNAYANKGPLKIEHGDAKDMNGKFFLRLDMPKASRGATGLRDAAVYLYPSGTYTTLPQWFSDDPDAQKPTEEELAERTRAQAQRSSEYQIAPFISERRYRIVPPPGFTLRSVPADKTTQMGPATLTQTYTVDASGVLTASMRFNTVKTVYTADEALALRKAVIDSSKEDGIAILFDEAGAKLIAQGKVREALAASRAVVDAHPKDALPHVRLADALLDVGLGDKARQEATIATQLDPKSAVASSTLGWIDQFNEIGVHYAKGFDLHHSIEAYQKAKELDPDDTSVRANLAGIEEYDTRGLRYSAEANLPEAIKEIRSLMERNKAEGEAYRDNLLYDMLYAHQYRELIAELATLQSSAIRNGLAIAATVALNPAATGVQDGIQRADRVSGSRSDRSTALRNAGSILVNLRLYKQAAEILRASLDGQENAAGVARQIELFQNVTAIEPSMIPTDKPDGVVRQLVANTMSAQLTRDELINVLTRHSFATEDAWQKNLEKSLESSESLQAIAERSGLTPSVLMDITLGSMKISTQGDDATGYRLTVQSIGSSGEQFFLVKEDGKFKIVASKNDTTEVGAAALYYLRNNQEPLARSLLDWKRDILHKGGGDDPLSGPLLPRFWTSGESQGPAAIELAAASLLVDQASISELLPAIAKSRDTWTAEQAAPGKPTKTDLNLLLAKGYLRIGDAANTINAARSLVQDAPDSTTAMALLGAAYSLNHNWSDWNALIDSRLAKHPTDHDLLAQKATAQQAQADFAAARKTLHQILDTGQATSGDYNSYAWNSLFEGKVDADALQAAQQSTAISKNANFADLHTLACIYAAQGKTTEARQVLFQALAAVNTSHPNSLAWYVFGAIYEQYGINDAAIAAFRKVEKPEGYISPTDTWVLAQTHLKALNAQ